MWGCFGSRQRGQLTSVGREAFHCERRVRVLLRDIFRFGTATSILLGHPRAVAGGRLSGHPARCGGEGVLRSVTVPGGTARDRLTGSLLAGVLCDPAERFPARVDAVAVTVIGSGLGHLDPALRAQAGAVRDTQR